MNQVCGIKSDADGDEWRQAAWRNDVIRCVITDNEQGAMGSRIATAEERGLLENMWGGGGRVDCCGGRDKLCPLDTRVQACPGLVVG